MLALLPNEVEDGQKKATTTWETDGERREQAEEDRNHVVPTGMQEYFLYSPVENAKDHRTKALCSSRVETSETDILGNGGLTNLQASVRKIPCCARMWDLQRLDFCMISDL